jgi:fido (protein-threonine AMPylation protein)
MEISVRAQIPEMIFVTLMEEPGGCETLDPSCLFSFHRYLFERIKLFADQSRSVGACSRNQAFNISASSLST